METRTYTERSNARRAARAQGVDPNLVFETEDGFTFPALAEDGAARAAPSAPAATANGNSADPQASAEQMKAKHADDAAGSDTPTTAAPSSADLRSEPDDGIPAALKLSPEARRAAWDKNPPKPAAIKQETAAMAKRKSKPGKPGKEKANGADKDALLHKMLAGKGSTVEAMTKALGWLPHTLRARISRLNKPKSKGGEGMKIERERVDGVTSYRFAS